MVPNHKNLPYLSHFHVVLFSCENIFENKITVLRLFCPLNALPGSFLIPKPSFLIMRMIRKDGLGIRNDPGNAFKGQNNRKTVILFSKMFSHENSTT